MGDRRNIIITEKVGEPGVAIYTHWGGSEAEEDLAAALDAPAARNRWDDTGYLTRIVFDRLTDGDHGSETGFGIYPSEDGSTAPCESAPGYDLIVETSTKRVFKLGKTQRSFEEFISKHNR